jgi:hypothetical protein
MTIRCFLCAPRSGIGQGGLIALKGIDADFNSRFIDVQRNLSRGKISLPKNGKDRKVDMSAKLGRPKRLAVKAPRRSLTKRTTEAGR